MAVELQEQLLAQERKLDGKEGIITAQEDGMPTSECALGRACTECDAECDQAEAVRHDYHARIHTSTSSCRRSFNFDQVLEGASSFFPCKRRT
jgi:hypothetical protein